MSKYILLCVLVLVCAVTSNAKPNFMTKVGNVLQKFPENMSKAGSIVLATIAGPVLNQCDNMKSMLGMTYDKISGGDKEPNFDSMSIDLMCPLENKTYLLPTAARDILADKIFDPSKKLYVFLHGWKSNIETYIETTQALFNTGNCNVMALDASEHIKNSYVPQSSYAAFIGIKLAAVLQGLYEAGQNPQDIHIIGHSLGAHVAGFTGKIFETLTGTKIGRITGLDPAGPCFMELDEVEHLNSNDANFVDVIHSNAGLTGINKVIGHVDFYPNGGGNQPGCNSMWCSHGRAKDFFTQSIINPEAFLAVKCDSWGQFKDNECAEGEAVPMGFGCTPDRRGIYYLQTSRHSPFGRASSGTKYDRYLPFDI